MREIFGRLMAGGEARFANGQFLSPNIQLGVERVGSLGNIRQQQLDRHLLAGQSPSTVAGALHPFLGITATGWRQPPLAFDLHHARAAIAVGPHALHVTQARNLDSARLRCLKNGFAGIADHSLAIQFERNRRRRQESALLVHYVTSSGKNLKTVSTGLGAAWPRPQIDASIIACERSSSSGTAQRFCCINWSALTVPTRHGVHWPQDSSAKNFMRLRAAPDAVSWFDNTTIAADPMKQPYSFKVSKSSGMSA